MRSFLATPMRATSGVLPAVRRAGVEGVEFGMMACEMRGEGGFGHFKAKIDECRGHGFWFGFSGWGLSSALSCEHALPGRFRQLFEPTPAGLRSDPAEHERQSRSRMTTINSAPLTIARKKGASLRAEYLRRGVPADGSGRTAQRFRYAATVLERRLNRVMGPIHFGK